MSMFRRLGLLLMAGVVMGGVRVGRGEAECTGWGDLRGIRYKGELLEVSSHLRVVRPGGMPSVQANGQTRAQGVRTGNVQVFTGTMAVVAGGGGAQGGGGRGRGPAGPAVNYRMEVEDVGADTVAVDVRVTAGAVVPLQGMYYGVDLPGGEFGGGSAELEMVGGEKQVVTLGRLAEGATRFAEGKVKAVRFVGKAKKVAVEFAEATAVVLEPRGNGGRGGRGGGGGAGAATLSIVLGEGDVGPEMGYRGKWHIKTSWDVDVMPVRVGLDLAKTGPGFVGVGGNFRLQSQQDGAHIAYNLEHLRVAWGRVQMPLDLWQPEEGVDALEAARAGRVNARVVQAMEMAGTLAGKKMPLIVSAWSAPGWALDPVAAAGNRGGGGGGGGNGARRVADEKWPAVYRSIAGYLVFLKEKYHVEPAVFSFNEPDQGINVKLTPEDQRLLFRELGAYLESRGIVTKMLLGDTGNPTPKPANFIEAAVGDPEAMKYVGAVSYHSWTGGSDQQLASWGAVAKRFGLPLVVGEGGSDPASYTYRGLLAEPWYGVDEINLYVRCLRFSQPVSILHWQLTENYSILKGGQNGRALEPAQRFYNLKQLNLTPVAAPAVGVTVDRPLLTVAAYGDEVHGCAVHLVNMGAARRVTVGGLPAGVKEVEVFVTDRERGMQEMGRVAVKDGVAEVEVGAQAFVTLRGGR